MYCAMRAIWWLTSLSTQNHAKGHDRKNSGLNKFVKRIKEHYNANKGFKMPFIREILTSGCPPGLKIVADPTANFLGPCMWWAAYRTSAIRASHISMLTVHAAKVYERRAEADLTPTRLDISQFYVEQIKRLYHLNQDPTAQAEREHAMQSMRAQGAGGLLPQVLNAPNIDAPTFNAPQAPHSVQPPPAPQSSSAGPRPATSHAASAMPTGAATVTQTTPQPSPQTVQTPASSTLAAQPTPTAPPPPTSAPPQTAAGPSAPPQTAAGPSALAGPQSTAPTTAAISEEAQRQAAAQRLDIEALEKSTEERAEDWVDETLDPQAGVLPEHRPRSSGGLWELPWNVIAEDLDFTRTLKVMREACEDGRLRKQDVWSMLAMHGIHPQDVPLNEEVSLIPP